jgi:hypothetical protein
MAIVAGPGNGTKLMREEKLEREIEIWPARLGAGNQNARRRWQSQEHPAAVTQKRRSGSALAAGRSYPKNESICVGLSEGRAEPENPRRENQIADLPYRQHFSPRKTTGERFAEPKQKLEHESRNSEGHEIRLRALRSSED